MSAKGRLLIIGGHEDRSDNRVEMKDTNSSFSPHEILKLLADSKSDHIEIITDQYKVSAVRGCGVKALQIRRDYIS